MTLPFQLEAITPKQGFFPVGSCFGIHINTPRIIDGEVEVESFESPLFIIHQVTYLNTLQAYIVEPFYRYVEQYHNVVVIRRIKALKNVTSPVKVTHSLGSLNVICDEANSMAIFCIDTSSRPVT